MTCPACRDSWNWIALYDDEGTLALLECNGDGRHLAFGDIDLPRVRMMVLQPLRRGLPQLSVKISGPDVEPIFFRRRLRELSLSSGVEVAQTTIHCLGWRKKFEDGRSVESFTFAFEDGSILVTDDRQAV